MLPKLLRALSLIFTTTLLITACSRETDVIFPPEVKNAEVNTCSDAEPNADLLNGLSMRTESTHTSVAGIAFDQPFSNGTYLYTAAVSPLINNVRVFPSQVLPELEGTVQRLSVKLSVDSSTQSFEETLEYLQESSFVYLSEGTTTITLNLEAVIGKEGFYVDCEPTNEQLAEDIVQNRTYVINIERRSFEDSFTTFLGNEALVDGTSLGPFYEDDMPLETGDRFANSVAIYGDVAVIGVPGDDSGDARYSGDSDYAGSTLLDGTTRQDYFQYIADKADLLQDSGIAYVFERQLNSSWQLTHVLKPRFPDAGDQFGHAVAIYDNKIAVSAPYEDSSSTGVSTIENNELAKDSGAVYVYEREGDDWNQKAYVKAPSISLGNDGFYDAFGERLVLDTDRLFVGAPLDDAGGVDSGSVFVYELMNDSWQHTANLSSDLVQAGDKFGSAISVNGDFAAVGAPGDDSELTGITNKDEVFEVTTDFENNAPFSATNSGAAYVFQLEDDVWDLHVYIKSENADNEDRFGTSVAIAGSDLYVGAPGEDSSGARFNRNMALNDLSNSGAAYQFVYSSELDRWEFKNYIKSFSPSSGALFGQSLAADFGFVLIGATNELVDAGVGGTSQGRLYLVERLPTGLFHSGYFYIGDDDSSTALERSAKSASITPGAMIIGAPGSSVPVLDPDTQAVLSYETEVGGAWIWD